jgi:hypothetical protein
MSVEERCQWRVNDWLKAVGISRPTLYERIREGKVDARKDGRSTVILTPPRAYLEALPRGIGEPPIGAPRRKASTS